MNAANFKRIAVLRLCGVGDAVQMTPLLRQLRADAPEAEIVVFVSANAAPVLRGAPWMDRVVALEPAATKTGASNPGLIKLWMNVRREGAFDALLCLGLTWRNLVLSRLARARSRAGFVTRGWKPLPVFTHPYFVPENAALDRTHESQKYLKLWSLVSGGEDRGFGYDLAHLGHGLSTDLPLPDKPYLCVAPGAGNPFVRMDTKKWPSASFARVIELALAEGYEVLVLGTPGELPAERLPSGARDLQGKTTLPQAAALLRGSSAFLGNDSGLFHLALGLGTPAAAIFGPTDAAKTGPFRNANALVIEAGLECAPCLAESCRMMATSAAPGTPPPCMTALTPERVWQRMQPLLETAIVAARL